MFERKICIFFDVWMLSPHIFFLMITNTKLSDSLISLNLMTWNLMTSLSIWWHPKKSDDIIPFETDRRTSHTYLVYTFSVSALRMYKHTCVQWRKLLIILPAMKVQPCNQIVQSTLKVYHNRRGQIRSLKWWCLVCWVNVLSMLH